MFKLPRNTEDEARPIKVKVRRPAIDLFALSADHFPEATRDYFSASDIVKLGVLPLGLKAGSQLFRPRQFVNLGLLDPSRKDAVKLAKDIVAERLGNGFSGVRLYLVLPEDFLAVLEKVYAYPVRNLVTLKQIDVDPTLLRHISSLNQEVTK